MIGESLRAALKLEGHAVDWVTDAQAAATTTATERFDLVLLDLGLPKGNGLDVLRGIRARDDSTPVIVLTARDGLGDRVAGLDAGADDYLSKPFELDELLARMRAVLRRHSGRAATRLTHEDLSFDPATREVTLRGEPVMLSARELAVLEALLQRPGAILSRAQLEDRLYGWGEEVESNAVSVYVHQLRKKLGPELIRTMRGVGYYLGKRETAPERTGPRLDGAPLRPERRRHAARAAAAVAAGGAGDRRAGDGRLGLLERAAPDREPVRLPAAPDGAVAARPGRDRARGRARARRRPARLRRSRSGARTATRSTPRSCRPSRRRAPCWASPTSPAGGIVWRTFGVEARDRVIQVAQPQNVRHDARRAGRAAQRRAAAGRGAGAGAGDRLAGVALARAAAAPGRRGALARQRLAAGAAGSTDLPDEVLPLVQSLNALLDRLGRRARGAAPLRRRRRARAALAADRAEAAGAGDAARARRRDARRGRARADRRRRPRDAPGRTAARAGAQRGRAAARGDAPRRWPSSCARRWPTSRRSPTRAARRWSWTWPTAPRR